MYQIGDFVMYGSTGACRITDISNTSLPGEKKKELYYKIVPVFQNCTIYAPVNSDKVFMRPIISKEEAEALIDSIPAMKASAYEGHASKDLTEHYEKSIQTHDCRELVELTMSIYEKMKNARNTHHKIGVIDTKYMKRAEERLFEELSVALGVDKENIAHYIEERVAMCAER